jgi:hypothetical protein
MLRVLLLFALGLLIGRAGAATVYKCTDGKDHVAYQATPCAPHLTTRVMQLRRGPVAAPAADDGARATKAARSARSRSATAQRTAKSQPVHVRGASNTNVTATRSRGAGNTNATATRSRAAGSAPQSWQCRIGNGEVYYQHSPCPGTAIASVDLRDSRTRGRSRGAAQAVPVSATPLSRTEACRRIHAASASGRAGHERDEDVSSYERSLGRDPCR